MYALSSLLLILATTALIWAAILPITAQTIIVIADKAANGPAADRAFTPLNDIVITEGNSKDFGNGSFTLTAPSGWQFNPAGTISAIPNSTNITIGNITKTATSIVVNFTIVNANQGGFDQIIIRGVEVQALNGNVLSSNSEVILSSNLNGIGLPIPVARLSQVHGTARKLAFSQQPSTADVYSIISPAVTLLVQDFFGHTVTGGGSASSNITLTIGTNPGGGVLAGSRTVAASNGLATFSNLSIDASGGNYTLVASSGTLTSATSSTFSITSTTPVLDEVVTTGCYTIGAPEQTITLRGSNFARNSVGRIGSSNRPTTYISPNELRMTLLESDMAVAGDKAINVLNLNPTAVSATHIVVVHHTIQTASIRNSTRSPECTGGGETYTAPADFTDYVWSVTEGATMTSTTATSNVFSIRFNDVAPASGKVTVTVKATNPCGIAGTRSFDILVNQTPPDVITYDTPTTFCEGGSVVLKAPVAASGEPAYRYQWLLNGAAIPDATSSTYKAEAAGGYRVTVRAADPNVCSNTSSTVTVSITSPLTQGAITGGTTYCQLAPVTSATALTASIEGGVTNTGATPARTYQWQQSSSASGPWTNATGTTSTGANYLPSTAETGTTYYRRTVFAGGCEYTTEPVAVTVKPNPVIAVETNKPAICQGETVELTASGADSYIWSGTGIPAGATGAKVTVTPAATTTYTVRGVTDDCQSAPQTITITVTPTLTQGVITGATQYCQTPGGIGTALSSTVSGGVTAKSYRWEQSTNGSSNWEPAENTNTGASYTPSISEAGTMYYRRVVESGSCVSLGEPVAVTVTPAITNTITTADQVVCSNETIGQLAGVVSGGNPGDVSYQWEQSATGTGSWTNALGASTAINYTPTAEPNLTTSKTTYYRRKVISGNCTSNSEPVSVRIVAMPVAEITDGPNDYFCPPASATLTARTGAGYRYTWFKVVPGGNDEQVGTDQNTYTTNEEGSYYVVVKGENDCTSTSAPTQVKSTIMYTNIISGAQTICYNTVPATLEGEESTSDLGTVTYEWQVSADGTNFSRISSTNVQNLTLTTALTADRWYRRIARVGSGCSITSSPVKVTVKPLLRVTNLPGTAPAICNNTTYAFTPEGSEGSKTITWSRAEVAGISNDAASGTGGINETLVNTTTAPINVTYVYTTSDDEGCTGPAQNLVVRVNPTPQLSSSLSPTAVCGGTEFDYTASSATTGTTYTWVRKPAPGITTTAPENGVGARVEHILTNTTPDPIDVTYTYTLTANGCSNTQDVVVRVNPRPQLSSTLSPAAICSGTTFSYTPASATEGATYTWTRVAATGITTTDAASGTGAISQTLVNTSANPIAVTYRVTTTANGCAGTVENVVVTVNPSPKLSTPLTASVCSGSTFSYEPASATEGATFSWTRAASGGNAASSGTGAIGEALTNTTTAPFDVIYEVTTRANGCNGTPQSLVVTVHPRPVLSNIPTAASVCSGSLFTYTPQSLTPNASFTWTRAAVNGISNAAVTSPRAGSISETLVNTTANPINVTYVYTTTASGCAGSEQNVVVTVNPRPALSNIPTAASICSGGAFSYTPASATDGATYSWTRIAPASISGGATTGTGGVSQNLTNSSTAPVTVTYRYTTTANGCPGTSTEDVNVIVNPSPKLSSSLTPTAVCSGSTFSYTPMSATTGTTYTWTRAAVAGISNAAVTDGTGGVSETLVNTTASAINVTYVFTTTANGCSGTPQNVVVRVNPKPVATFSGVTDGQVVYSDGGNVTLVPTVAGGAFSIVSPSGTTGLTSGGVLTPCTALGSATEKEITIRYTISQTSNGVACTASEEKKVVLKRSKYVVVIEAVPFPTCRGQNTTYRAVVYKDPVSVTYPYLVNGDGQPVDGQGNLLGAKTYPIPNPAYPFPANAPQILKDNAYRYYQPIVTGGVRVNDGNNAGDFIYRWTKNYDVYPFGNTVEAGNAGLSSEDYYAVSITAGPTNSCISPITTGGLWSNRTYTAAPINYEVDLVTDKSTICEGGAITMSANLDAAFAFWKDIELTLYWMVQRPGVTTPIQLGSTTYTTGNIVTFNTTGPTGGFRDGDVVFVEFSSVIDRQNDVNSKCSRGFTTNQIPITVVGPQTLNGGGAYCEGGAGIPVSIAGSQLNVFYQLTRDGQPVGSPMAGTGAAMNFGNQTVAGEYRVQTLTSAAATAAACLESNAVSVYITPLPVVQELTIDDNGEFCAGGSGVPITLSNSQTGVKYQLQRTVANVVTNVGQEVIGNGQPIVFGNQTEPGIYSVLATTLPTSGTVAACPLPMGNVTVTVNPLPLANRTFNNPTYCSLSSDGADVVLQNPESGVAYELFDGSKSLGTFSGTGSTRSLANVPAGEYTVRGVNNTTNCVNPSVGTVRVTDTRAIADVTGEMTYKWVGTDKWELMALPETTKPFTEIPADATYSWFVKEPGDADFKMYASGKSKTITITGFPQGTEIVARVSLTDKVCQLVQFVPGEIIPLPVELLYFNATKRGNDVVLDWATASELDNKGFEVQVSSDAKNFRVLGFVESKVNTTSLKQLYTFVDKENGKQGVRYYRLKQVDLDGKSEIFNIKAVHFYVVSANKVKAYPNPFHSEVELSIDAELDGELQITVTTATGQQLLQRTVQVAKGTNIEKLTLDPNLPRGVYIISTRMGDFNSHFKLLKQ